MLHAGIYVSMPVNTFTVTMYLIYFAFVDPDKVHAIIDRLSGVKPTGPPAEDSS